MKFHPPKVLPGEDCPFDNAFRDRKEFAESLHRLLISCEDNLVAYVDAGWGEGKTTFVKLFKEYVRRTIVPTDPEFEYTQKPDLILFDAFSHDQDEDPFTAFAGEIAAFASDQTELLPSEEFIKKSAKVLLGLGRTFFEKASPVLATLATSQMPGTDVTTDMAAAAGNAAADIATRVVNRTINDAQETIESVSQFKQDVASFEEELGRLASNYKKQTGFPLTIIVDELDRCKPDYALKLIERIKHYFAIDGVCFLLFANMEQLVQQVEITYGPKRAHEYLQKFSNLRIQFPSNRGKYDSNIKHHSKSMLSHFSNEEIHYNLTNCLTAFSDYLNLSLRETEMAARYFSILHTATNGDLLHFAICLLIVIKIKDPLKFEEVKDPSFGYSSIVKYLLLPKDAEHQGLLNFQVKMAPFFITASEHESLSEADRNAHFGMRGDHYNYLEIRKKTFELLNRFSF